MSLKGIESRYSRQIRLPQIGEEGQRRIRRACVSVVGLGALGGVQASYLTRAGVGRLRLIDRDTVELPNLQRQILFSERDVAEDLPKAAAAERHLSVVNSEVRIDGISEHLGSENAREILEGSDLVLDGTDNFETRLLINDFCVDTGTPWIYGACVGTEGLCAAIFPGEGPCLRCFLAPDASGVEPTCDTSGILGPLAGVVGSLQATWALLVLSGDRRAVPRGVVRFDAGRGRFGGVLEGLRPDPACVACGGRRFEYLEGARTAAAYVLCGRGAVQIAPPGNRTRDLEAAERRLGPFGEVSRNRYLVKARIEGYTLSLFPDGRIIVGGTTDAAQARAVVDRYLGGA